VPNAGAELTTPDEPHLSRTSDSGDRIDGYYEGSGEPDGPIARQDNVAATPARVHPRLSVMGVDVLILNASCLQPILLAPPQERSGRRQIRRQDLNLRHLGPEGIAFKSHLKSWPYR
jgi:hypothetical protein